MSFDTSLRKPLTLLRRIATSRCSASRKPMVLAYGSLVRIHFAALQIERSVLTFMAIRKYCEWSRGGRNLLCLRLFS